MNRLFKTLRHSLRFRRWSRKAYSLFVSCNNHVTIGHVCKSIVDASCRKTSNTLSPVILSCKIDCIADDEEVFGPSSGQWLELDVLSVLFSTINVGKNVCAQTSESSICRVEYLMFNNISPYVRNRQF